MNGSSARRPPAAPAHTTQHPLPQGGGARQEAEQGQHHEGQHCRGLVRQRGCCGLLPLEFGTGQNLQACMAFRLFEAILRLFAVQAQSTTSAQQAVHQLEARCTVPTRLPPQGGQPKLCCIALSLVHLPESCLPCPTSVRRQRQSDRPGGTARAAPAGHPSERSCCLHLALPSWPA